MESMEVEREEAADAEASTAARVALVTRAELAVAGSVRAQPGAVAVGAAAEAREVASRAEAGSATAAAGLVAKAAAGEAVV